MSAMPPKADIKGAWQKSLLLTLCRHSLYLLRRLENADILPLNSNKGWPRPDSFTLKERLNIFAKPIWKHLGPMNSAVDVAPICRLALSICSTVFYIKVGTFDDPSLFDGPGLAIQTTDMQSFNHLPDDAPRFEHLPVK